MRNNCLVICSNNSSIRLIGDSHHFIISSVLNRVLNPNRGCIESERLCLDLSTVDELSRRYKNARKDRVALDL